MSVTLAWHYFGVRVVTLTCSVPIESLDLHKNEVSGTIPSEVGFSLRDTTVPHQNDTDAFGAYGNNLVGPFTCPEFIELCLVSCDDRNKCQCRIL